MTTVGHPFPSSSSSSDLDRATPVTEGQKQALRTVGRLTLMELRLMVREPMVLVGLLGLPVVAMVVIAGVFGQTPDPDFGSVAPDDYYVAGYLGVVLASLGLVTLPVHIATNRELGVIRRFRASGLGASELVASHLAVGVVLGTVSSAIVLTIGHLVYDIGTPIDPWGVAAWYTAGLLCFIAIGGALGLVVSSGRAANAIGNVVFIPTFLLAGGGPPRDVMTGAMQAVSDVIPLSHVTGGLRQEWLGATDAHVVYWWPLAVCAVAVAAASWVARRRAD